MTEDIISRIDQAVGCQQCSKALKPNGPSVDFCSEECQKLWHATRVTRRPVPRRPPSEWFPGDRVGWSGQMDNTSARFTPAEPLRPSVPVSERVAAVERFASHAGITLSAWQRQAIETLYTGGIVTRGRQNGWSTIAGLMQAEADQRRIHGLHPDQVIIDEPFATVHANHEDCRCELLEVVATDPAEVSTRSIYDTMARLCQAPPAERRTEPIKLTREQWEQLLHSSPDPGPPAYVVNGALPELTGIPVVLVDTLEESTPYIEGWLNAGREAEPEAADPQRGWLAKWFNRMRGGR